MLQPKSALLPHTTCSHTFQDQHPSGKIIHHQITIQLPAQSVVAIKRNNTGNEFEFTHLSQRRNLPADKLEFLSPVGIPFHLFFHGRQKERAVYTCTELVQIPSALLRGHGGRRRWQPGEQRLGPRVWRSRPWRPARGRQGSRPCVDGGEGFEL